jgi:hypothetical protein
MVEYILCHSAPAVHWCLLPATRLASKKILNEQNIKRQRGPALYVVSLLGPPTQLSGSFLPKKVSERSLASWSKLEVSSLEEI